MKYVIIEDESPAARRLRTLIESNKPEFTFLTHLQSIEEAENWFQTNDEPDLMFVDIHLGDGLIFEYLDKLCPKCLLIFTTAYDQYALKAFESNSVDYLLKPVTNNKLKRAFEKIDQRIQRPEEVSSVLKKVMESVQGKSYKNRFLGYLGDQMYFVSEEDVAYFVSEDGVTILCTRDNKRFILKDKLETLAKSVNPAHFFRINRGLVVSPESIERISPYFNSRLKLQLKPPSDLDAVVARERVKDFKAWLGE